MTTAPTAITERAAAGGAGSSRRAGSLNFVLRRLAALAAPDARDHVRRFVLTAARAEQRRRDEPRRAGRRRSRGRRRVQAPLRPRPAVPDPVPRSISATCSTATSASRRSRTTPSRTTSASSSRRRPSWRSTPSRSPRSSASRSASSSALRRNRATDHALRFASLAGISMPTFWIALLALYVGFYRLGWFPGGGPARPGTTPPPHVTGLYTIDALLAGQPRPLLGGAAPSAPARARARARSTSACSCASRAPRCSRWSATTTCAPRARRGCRSGSSSSATSCGPRCRPS